MCKRMTLVCLAVIGLVAGLAGAAGANDKVKVLMVDGQNNHNWKVTTPIMKDILVNCGRFTVDVATSPPRGKDMAAFRPAFDRYDVVVSNYNGAEWSEPTKKAFVDYVRNGGGLVIVHAADNAFPNWPQYNEIIGVGGWGGRNEKSGPFLYWKDGKIVRDTSAGRGGGHGKQHEYLIVARQPDHPILKGLPAQWRHAQDELYHQLRGPAKNLQVLATTYSDPKYGGTGRNEPALMTIQYGKGRVFHMIMGHGDKAMSGVGFQVMLQRGTEWAATGQVTLPPVSAEQLPADKAAYRDPKDIKPVAFTGALGGGGSGWVDLFDGKTLTGWTQRNGTATYRVKNNCIVGKTHQGSPNSFLCTDKLYGDFELVFDVKVDHALNSGVQIRSKTRGGPTGRVYGPQVEIATTRLAGYLYAEAMGHWMTPQTRRKPHRHFRDGQWNHYRVLAVGPNIKVWLNGAQISDLTDEPMYKTHPKGFIGLQVHAIGKNAGPYEVSWRNIKIRPIR